MGEDFFCAGAEFGKVLFQGFFLGLAIGIALLIVARKCGLLRRESTIRRVLVGIWCFVVPLLCGLALSAWMSISFVADELETGLEPLRAEIGAASVQMADAVWAEVVRDRPDSPEDLKSLLQSEIRRRVDADILRGILSSPDTPDILVPFLDAFLDASSDRFAHLVYEQVVQQLSAKAADALALPPEQLAPLWREGVTEALRRGLVLDLLKGFAVTPLKGIRAQALVLFGAPLLLIALETAQAAWARRRKRMLPAVPAQQAAA